MQKDSKICKRCKGYSEGTVEDIPHVKCPVEGDDWLHKDDFYSCGPTDDCKHRDEHIEYEMKLFSKPMKTLKPLKL